MAVQKENQRDALGAFVADGIQNRTISIISEEQLKAREKEHTSVKVKKMVCAPDLRKKKRTPFFIRPIAFRNKQTNGRTKHKSYSTSTSSPV